MTTASDLKAGDLRYPIKIVSLSTAKDSYGASTNDWSNVVRSCRASFDPLLGKEYFAAEEQQSQVEVKFRTRYSKGINNTMRILFYSDVYEILSAIDVGGQNKELLMYCKKVINGV